METILLWWIFCGAIGAAIGALKGKWATGLLLGALLGPLGVLISMFLSKSDNIIENNESNNRKCPFCAEMIKNEAIICKHCGKDVLPIILDKKSIQPVEAPKEICYTCTSYVAGSWDKTSGKCSVNNQKTLAYKTCEHFTAAVNRA